MKQRYWNNGSFKNNYMQLCAHYEQRTSNRGITRTLVLL